MRFLCLSFGGLSLLHGDFGVELRYVEEEIGSAVKFFLREWRKGLQGNGSTAFLGVESKWNG